MGFKQDLIDAKVKAAKDNGIDDLDTKPGSFIEREAEYTKEAIVNFLTECQFKITKLNAPVIVENLKTPDQTIDVKKDTILKDKDPLFKTITQIGNLIPGAGPQVSALMNQVELATETNVEIIRVDGATLPGLNLSKDGRNTFKRKQRLGQGGGLISDGYVYIGEDPETQESFDVTDEDGQRDFTEVKLFRQDIEDLL